MLKKLIVIIVGLLIVDTVFAAKLYYGCRKKQNLKYRSRVYYYAYPKKARECENNDLQKKIYPYCKKDSGSLFMFCEASNGKKVAYKCKSLVVSGKETKTGRWEDSTKAKGFVCKRIKKNGT